jgi:hypothetical protein
LDETAKPAVLRVFNRSSQPQRHFTAERVWREARGEPFFRLRQAVRDAGRSDRRAAAARPGGHGAARPPTRCRESKIGCWENEDAAGDLSHDVFSGSAALAGEAAACGRGGARR